jgi:hypothetical protein
VNSLYQRLRTVVPRVVQRASNVLRNELKEADSPIQMKARRYLLFAPLLRLGPPIPVPVVVQCHRTVGKVGNLLLWRNRCIGEDFL